MTSRQPRQELGSGCYLEIIGPDPDQVEPERPRPFGIDRLDEPRLVTWAVRESRLAERRERALVDGIDLGEPRSMSRARPDGALLEWRLMRPPPAQPVGSEPRSEDPLRSGIVPFFIDWGRTPSPAVTAASGCRLSSLRAESREAVEVQRVLELLRIEIPVVQGPANSLIAEIETPKGLMELS